MKRLFLLVPMFFILFAGCEERNDINKITLTSQASQMIAGRGNLSKVIATCIQKNGERAPDGTEVLFSTRNFVQHYMRGGRFTEDQVFITSGSGQAETYYIASYVIGTSILTAMVRNAYWDKVVSNEVFIRMLPGPPTQLRIRGFQRQIATDDSEAYYTIIATVTDTAGNHIEVPTLVSFHTTMGSIPSSTMTDSTGKARVRLTPGVITGIAEITATVAGLHGQIEGYTTVQFTAALRGE